MKFTLFGLKTLCNTAFINIKCKTNITDFNYFSVDNNLSNSKHNLSPMYLYDEDKRIAFIVDYGTIH